MMSTERNKTDTLPFFKLPKLLFTDAGWSEMSLDAKVLYGLFLDRLSLSRSNGWYDCANRLYIIYSISSIRDTLKCGKSKAIKLMKELETYGLIERLKRRKNLTDLIYVNSIDAAPESAANDNDVGDNTQQDEPQPESLSTDERCSGTELKLSASDIQELDLHTSECDSGGADLNHGGVISPPREVYESDLSKTEFNNTECNYIYDRWIDKMDGKNEIHTMQNKIKQQIDYDTLIKNYPYRCQREVIDEIVENIMEIYFVRSGADISIGSRRYPVAYVKYRYSKLDYDRIAYIMGSMERNRSKIKNIKQYMVSVLFNAASTCGCYYSSEANHDISSLKDDLSELLSQRIRI